MSSSRPVHCFPHYYEKHPIMMPITLGKNKPQLCTELYKTSLIIYSETSQLDHAGKFDS